MIHPLYLWVISRLRRMHQERYLFIDVTDWAHLVRFHPMLQYVSSSRGWNITELVNGNVGNQIELGMKILTIKSHIL
jgi:hypothetical protein